MQIYIEYALYAKYVKYDLVYGNCFPPAEKRRHIRALQLRRRS